MILAEPRAPRVLLDTCAIIYVFNVEPVHVSAVATIEEAALVISPISAWEIGILGQKRGLLGVEFLPDPISWCRRVIEAPMVEEAPFTVEIALASSYLPEPLHKDPADRLLIATARQLMIPIMTRDRAILGYAAAGHIDAISC